MQAVEIATKCPVVHALASIATLAVNIDDGDFRAARFSQPQGMAWDGQTQTLHVADTGNHAIRAVDFAQVQVQTIAGNGTQSRAIFPHGGLGKTLSLNSPWDLVRVGQRLYIAMAGMHQIWVMDLETQRLETDIGTGAEGCVDGDRTVAAFAQPSGLATDGAHLYVADSETSSIRRVTLGRHPSVTTLCGSGALFDYGDRDAVGDAVRLQHPMGVAVISPGDPTDRPPTPLENTPLVYIADTYNHKLKQLSPTGACATLVSALHRPAGVASSQHGLYIADTHAHRVMVSPGPIAGQQAVASQPNVLHFKLEPLLINGLP